MLARHYGFTEEELDFIINYDIKNRKGNAPEGEARREGSSVAKNGEAARKGPHEQNAEEFVLGGGEETAELQINSMEQIFAEKLKSLVKLKFLSTRAKDVFDMYYLKERVDRRKFIAYLRVLMFDNKKCKTKSIDEVVVALRETFGSRKFMKELNKVRVNWLQVDPVVAANSLVQFVSDLK